jgi:V-type H+-transporting ATPase subunit C
MQEMAGIDNDIKTKYGQYNQAKTNLSALQRRQEYAGSRLYRGNG